jgi:hypothetical protein
MLQRFCCAKVGIISIETQINIIYFQNPHKYLTLLTNICPNPTTYAFICCIFTKGNETGISIVFDNPKKIVHHFPDYSLNTP